MSASDTPEGHARIKAIVIAALDLVAEERAAYLDEVCAGDVDLRHEVDSLLVESISGSELNPTAAFERGVEDATVEAVEEQIPKELAGRYRIDGYLAEGGMGRVYKAHDLELGEPVAIKTIHPRIATNPVYLRLFKQEVLLARSITHPNVCRIFELNQDEADGTVFLTMEFLEGETLSSRIKSVGRLEESSQSLDLVRDMANALDAAHRAGIVHRDFKSPNVMVVPADGLPGRNDGSRALITDFGLAVTTSEGEEVDGGSESSKSERIAPGSSPDDETLATTSSDVLSEMDTTAAGGSGSSKSPRARRTIVGTPAYMAPEQVTGDRVGPASDLYALGIVLFEMCTGQLPFRGTTALETAHSHVTSPPPRPSDLVSVSDTWEQTILRLLAKNPDERYPTAQDVVAALAGRNDEHREVRHSLLPERDIFVGREQELADFAAHLEPDLDSDLDGSTTGATTERTDPHERDGAEASRLLTLRGPGGTGKTRLAQKYGWDSLLRWPGGVWFCDLIEARSVNGIVQAVGAALKVQLNQEDSVLQLGHVIRALGKCLFILDNFEQLIPHAEATIGQWLERAPAARFLVTTRERLRLPGETTYELDPLDPTTRGVELFESRAWGHRPGFAVDTANRRLVTEIVEALDGLPLAIELAASRLRQLTPAQITEGLKDRFLLLAGGEGRHGTMEATLDWSWDLLRPWEQSAIAQASVFDGGFTLEAAETVIDLTNHEGAPTVLDVLQSLIDKSWLRAKVEFGSPRFDMYVTVRDYVEGKLQVLKDGETNEAQTGSAPLREVERRHGFYFAGMGSETSIADLDRHGGVRRRAALCLELENLLAATRRAMANHDQETAVATYVAVNEILLLQGPHAPSIELGRKLLTILDDGPLRARTLSALAEPENSVGSVAEATAHLEKALVLHRTAGDQRGEGVVLGCLGRIHDEAGRADEAEECFASALTLLRAVGDRNAEGHVLASLGRLRNSSGRFAEASAPYEAALAIFESVGNRRAEGIVRGNRAGVQMGLGRTEDARRDLEAALTIHREVGFRHGVGNVLGNLGLLYNRLGRQEEARQHHEKALVIVREVGNRASEGHILSNLGMYYLDKKQLERARQIYEQALFIHREVGNRRLESLLLSNVGVVLTHQDRWDDAEVKYEAALAIARDIGHRSYEAVNLGNLALVRDHQGRLNEARELLDTALAIHCELGDRRWEATTCKNLASIHLQVGRGENAREWIDRGATIFRELEDPLSLGKILCKRVELERLSGDFDAAASTFREVEALAEEANAWDDIEMGQSIAALREHFDTE